MQFLVPLSILVSLVITWAEKRPSGTYFMHDDRYLMQAVINDPEIVELTFGSILGSAVFHMPVVEYSYDETNGNFTLFSNATAAKLNPVIAAMTRFISSKPGFEMEFPAAGRYIADENILKTRLNNYDWNLQKVSEPKDILQLVLQESKGPLRFYGPFTPAQLAYIAAGAGIPVLKSDNANTTTNNAAAKGFMKSASAGLLLGLMAFVYL